MLTILLEMAVNIRQQIEEVAERIVLLSDAAGKDVIEGFSNDIFDDGARAAFVAISNQYERALWFYINEPILFEEALNARQADVFRQSVSCYSGFVAPKNLAILDNESARQAFHQAVAQKLSCDTTAVAVQVFKSFVRFSASFI